MKCKFSGMVWIGLLAASLLSACGGSSGSLPAIALLQSIAVTPGNQTSATGGTVQFTAIGTYGDGSTANITASAVWSSSNPSVATINTSGLASGLAAGTATITATSGAVTGSNSLTVSSAVLQSIVVTPSNPNIAPGTTQQLTATGTYTDGSTANITANVIWTSFTPLIATVNASGLATGITAGTSIFTASLGIVSASTVPALANEVEPNDTSAQANVLTPSVALTGQLSSNTDLDYFKVTATGAGTISVAFATSGNNSPGYGWSFSILDPASTVLASATCALTICSQTLPTGIGAAGTYYVLVEPPAGTPAALNSSSNYTLIASLSASTNTVELEPNNSAATANTLTSGSIMTGQLSSNLDQDWYKVTATSAGTISVAFATSGNNSPGYGWSFSILDPASTVLASATCPLTICSQTLPTGIGAAGTYYVLVEPPAGTPAALNSSSNYTLNVTAP